MYYLYFYQIVYKAFDILIFVKIKNSTMEIFKQSYHEQYVRKNLIQGSKMLNIWDSYLKFNDYLKWCNL